MAPLNLNNGIVVQVRVQREKNGAIFVTADADQNEITRQYDIKYQQSIGRFEKSWAEGVRGHALILPETGAEVFMSNLWCEYADPAAAGGVRLSSSCVGGTGPAWMVRWNLAARSKGLVPVCYPSGHYVPASFDAP